jgi:hypothetical protein
MTPSQIAEELKKAREAAQAKDAEAYKSMTPPAGSTKPREEPYRPEGFDFAYVDSKGHQGEAIPARPAPLGTLWQQPAVSAAPAVDVPEGATHRNRFTGVFYRIFDGALQRRGHSDSEWRMSLNFAVSDLAWDTFEPLTQPTAPTSEPTAPTEWQSTNPPCVGWYDTDDGARRLPLEARYWDGAVWSCAVLDETCKEWRRRIAQSHTPATIRGWRGPRLVGEAWPEPSAT